jgi:DNA invertase Pin-like site-specific DNA recombinase
MPKAISYVRFSSLQQGRGSTVERQEKMIQEWLRSHPEYEISHLSRVDEGLSGYKAEHLAEGAGLKAIQDAIRDGQIVKGDVLLVEAVDRLGRLKHLEMINLIGGILSAGVDIVTLDDNQRYNSESLDGVGAWLLTGKIQQAHSYSDALSRRIAKSYEIRREKAKKGEPIRIAKALWLDQDGKLKEPESSMVRASIELYKTGKGTRAILVALQEEFGSIAPKDTKSITRWLTTKALLGQWQGYKVFDALVEHSEFLELQRLYESRRLIGKPPESFFLSGLIKCARCEKSFNIRRQKPKATKVAPIDSQAYAEKPQILYANCRSYMKNDSCDNNATWPLEVLNFILNQTKHDLLIGVAEGRVASVEVGRQLNELQAEKETLSAEIPRIEHIYIKKGGQHYEELMNSQTARLKYIETEIGKITSSIAKPKKLNIKGEIELTEEEFEELEASFEQYRDKSQKELDLIVRDELLMKSVLKMYGYSIKIDGRKAYSPDSSNAETFTLGKRMQKYGCYVLEILYPENDQKKFVAIRRVGPVTWADSESDLIAELEERRLDDLCV